MKNQKGFTLIELILYIALVSIFIGGAIQFAWDAIYGQTKSRTQQEVNQALRFIDARIAYEIRTASSINSVSATSISLEMADSARNPTVISLSSGTIRIGQGSSGNCPTSAPCSLHGSTVSITSLTFTNLSSGSSSNIRYAITASRSNSSGRSEWDYAKSLTSSVELR